jgi:hypothetical protein
VLIASLALLAESFGRELRLLWRHRNIRASRFLMVAGRGQGVH